jgi:hypothetical protein
MPSSPATPPPTTRVEMIGPGLIVLSLSEPARLAYIISVP